MNHHGGAGQSVPHSPTQYGPNHNIWGHSTLRTTVKHCKILFILLMYTMWLGRLFGYCVIFRFRLYFRRVVCPWSCLQRRRDTDGTPPIIRRCSHSYSRSKSGIFRSDPLFESATYHKLTKHFSFSAVPNRWRNLFHHQMILILNWGFLINLLKN